MNNSDLNQWIRYHTEHFGDGFARYIEPEAVMRTYRDELAYVSLDDAKAATKRMIADEGQQPMGWHKHLVKVKQLSHDAYNARFSGQKRKFVGGEEVFDCYHCQDTGTVTILAPRFVEAVRRGLIKREPFDVPTSSKMYGGDNWRWGEYRAKQGLVRACRFVVACCCSRGKPDNFRGAVYSPDEHYPNGVPLADSELQQFNEFVNSLNDLVPANYVSSFDAFNEG